MADRPVDDHGNQDLLLARTQAADYEQRREAIIKKAAELFARAGFNGTSVADLAAACNTSKSLIYHYYASKEAILYAVMSSHIDQLIADVEQLASGTDNEAARLDALIHAFMGHYVGAADSQKVLLNELDNLPDEPRASVIAKQRRIIAVVQALLVALDPELAAKPARARARTMLLFGMINWTHTWYDPSGPVKPDEIADMALRMVQTS